MKILTTLFAIWLLWFANIHRLWYFTDGRAWVLKNLYNLPRFLAIPIAKNIANSSFHEEPKCLPCFGKDYLRGIAHTLTDGPGRIQYCPKCGLDRNDWPTYCKNKVVRVRNPKPRRSFRAAIRTAFWE